MNARIRFAVSVAAVLLPAMPPAAAAGFPDRPVQLISPYPAGGAADVLARVIGKELGAALGQPVVIVNKPGAGTVVGAQAVVSAEANGYTLLLSSNSTFSMNPAVYPKLPYNPAVDFEPVGMVAKLALAIFTQRTTPLADVAQLVAAAKAEPTKYMYASFGNATASHFAAEMFKVAADIQAAGGEAVFMRLDVTQEGDWQQAVATAEGRFGTLHILVNNAGVSGHGKVEDTPVEEWHRVMDINATGVFLGSKTAIPAMRRAGGGSIINISSQLGLVGVDNSSPQYQASKGAVRLLTKATAIQYAAEGIRANSVHPGPIETPMTAERRRDPEVYQLTVARIPLGRYGQPEDVAYGVLYLASDESSYVTGSELVIDGGWTAQ
jgi:NAD(P)-dependent dehydrogenase (short-subunit alcohol dehydrogenase family)